jgi:hypothetical protein
VVAKRVVVALVPVRLVMNADASVAPTAERLVVEATVIVVVASVEVPETERSVTPRLVVDACVAKKSDVVALVTNSAPIVPEAAEKLVVEANDAKRLVVEAVVAKKLVAVASSEKNLVAVALAKNDDDA